LSLAQAQRVKIKKRLLESRRFLWARTPTGAMAI
jgi:ABC-type lipoprotein export system ATPase subunit